MGVTKIFSNGILADNKELSLQGKLTGRSITLPDVDSGYPVASIIDAVGATIETFPRLYGYPDSRSFRLKVGALVPATNTIVESELWDIVHRNREALAGVGFHTSNVNTPAPKFGNASELETYRKHFIGNLIEAADVAMLAEPHALILGFSMEHFSSDVLENKAEQKRIEDRTGLFVATWADAAKAALESLETNRIGILCPFDPTGLTNAIKFFKNLGFEVVSAVGLGCASGVDVGHVPDFYKERAIREQLLPANPEAIVQCGTNLSSLSLAERLEPKIGVPIVGINAATLWYLLREIGIDAPLVGSTRLLRES